MTTRLFKAVLLTLPFVAFGLPAVHSAPPPAASAPTEAPAGFDGQTNGFVDQTTHDADRDKFAEVDGIADGLGPVYNAQSCRECHQNPIIGGGSQVTELRAGHFDGTTFHDAAGGSLINDRAIDPSIQERVPPGNEVRALRISLNTLGDGFVEAIDDSTLVAISHNQPPGMQGQVVEVPVLEASGVTRVGRFGWKAQHASVVSFSADAYLNEMGITNPFFPTENTSNGRSVAAFDTVPDPEDSGSDVQAFARFIRASTVPPRDPTLSATPDAQAGSFLFNQVGCVTCHVRNMVTVPAGTSINGGTLTVPDALGNKIIHPFSDFLLHDVGTGDGIVQDGGPDSRNKMRTAPLWGLRTHDRLMHDGRSLTLTDAILRHRGEAQGVILRCRSLSAPEQRQLLTFLMSL